LSDLLASISKSTTRVVDLYQLVRARYLVGVKGAETKASAVKLGSRPNFRTDHAGFPNPVPPGSNPGAIIENENLPDVSKGAGGEGVSQSPLKDKAFSTFLDQNPPLELRPENGIFAVDNSRSRPMARHRQQCHQATSEGQIAVAPLSLIAAPFNFRRPSTS
jgi:hypothetical protein